MLKNEVVPERAQMTIQYGACALQAGQIRPHARTHTHTENMQYLLLFHDNNGFVNAPIRVHTHTACLIKVLFWHCASAENSEETQDSITPILQPTNRTTAFYYFPHASGKTADTFKVLQIFTTCTATHAGSQIPKLNIYILMS